MSTSGLSRLILRCTAFASWVASPLHPACEGRINRLLRGGVFVSRRLKPGSFYSPLPSLSQAPPLGGLFRTSWGLSGAALSPVASISHGYAPTAHGRLKPPEARPMNLGLALHQQPTQRTIPANRIQPVTLPGVVLSSSPSIRYSVGLHAMLHLQFSALCGTPRMMGVPSPLRCS